MHTTNQDVPEEQFTSIRRACSKNIYGWKTSAGYPQYQFALKGGVLGRIYDNFEDARTERDAVMMMIKGD